MMRGVLKVVDKEPEETLRAVARFWLSSGKLSAILLPAVSKTGVITRALVTSPEKVNESSPFLPVMADNGAGVIAKIAKSPSPDVKVGVVLRSCEIRAVVELVKLQQIALDNLVLIGIDCFGSYKVGEFFTVMKGEKGFVDQFVKQSERYFEDPRLRIACQMCDFPVPPVFDLLIGYLGMNLEDGLWIESGSPKGEGLISGLEVVEQGDIPKERERLLKVVTSRHREEASKRIKEFDSWALGPEGIVRYLSKCINCHNCMKVCPVCYCRECFFESDALSKELADTVRLTRRKGLTRMPAGTLLYHLTRMNHMMSSCVQCGICEESCPMGVGLTVMYKKVAVSVQREFDYVAGRSLDEPLPLTTFLEDEFRKIGEG